jgi:predicted RNA binding protein YcfA (HicA-like mRNA interferase family)
MVTEQPSRQMVKELKRAGWKAIRTDGRHTVYGCSCGKHTFALPESHRTISPGVVRKCRKAIEECKG